MRLLDLAEIANPNAFEVMKVLQRKVRHPTQNNFEEFWKSTRLLEMPNFSGGLHAPQ
jgi:hypothetical protein